MNEKMKHNKLHRFKNTCGTIKRNIRQKERKEIG